MRDPKACTTIRRVLVAGLALAVILPATWVASGALGGKTVAAAAADTSDAAAPLSGKILPPEEVAVIAPTSGAVTAVLVEKGDSVRAGQVLAVLANDETKLEAPVAGVVTRVSISRGSVVRPNGAAPFSISPQTPLRLVVEVDAATSRALRPSSMASFTLPNEKQASKAHFSFVRTEPNGPNSLRYLASFQLDDATPTALTGVVVRVALSR